MVSVATSLNFMANACMSKLAIDSKSLRQDVFV